MPVLVHARVPARVGEYDQGRVRRLQRCELEVYPQLNLAPVALGGLVVLKCSVEGAVSGLLPSKIRFDENPPERNLK